MMKGFLTASICITISLTFLYCNTRVSQSTVADRDRLRCIVVTEELPMPDSTGKLRLHTTLSIPIYYYKNLTAYKLAYTMIKKWDAQGNIVDQEDQYKYFIFGNADAEGYIYDSYYAQKRDTVSVDSMLQDELWCEQNSRHFYESNYSRNAITLLSSEWSSGGNKLHEVYSYRRKDDSTTHGTFTLTFTNSLKDIRFSMSREMDSIKGMKLVGTSAKGYFQYPRNGLIVKDTATAKDFMYEVILSPKDSLEIMHYFNRYRQEKGK